MSTPFATFATDLGPIHPDWTIAELMAWLSDDSRQHDPELQHPLALIEAALTGEHWSRTPSTIALIRSLTTVWRGHAASTVAGVLLPSQTVSRRMGGRHTVRPERMPQPQVA